MWCSVGSEEILVVSLVLNIPEPGQLIDVRQRHYVVVDVAQNVLPPDLLKSGCLSSRFQHDQYQHRQSIMLTRYCKLFLFDYLQTFYELFTALCIFFDTNWVPFV